nr:6897_t:CDS:2 [Entrophospora candida]
MGRVSNKNQHLKKIAQSSIKFRQESIKDKDQEINNANELNEFIDNEML